MCLIVCVLLWIVLYMHCKFMIRLSYGEINYDNKIANAVNSLVIYNLA